MKVCFRSHLIVLLALCLPAAASAEIRKWTNSAGVSIDAEMTAVDVTARTITIKKADGQSFTIPISTLSEADKAFAAAEWKKMQSAPATVVPASPATPAVPGAPATAPAPAAPEVAGKPAPPRPALTILPAKGFKVPASTDYLVKALKTRPRLIHAAPGWTYLKGLPATDPVAAKVLANLKAGGEAVLAAPELTRIFGEQRGTSTPGSKALFRMACLGALNFVDGDPRWKERGVREMISITDPATFQNWYVSEPAVTADFLIAASLGYDYFKDGMTAKQVLEARTYMIEKGIGALVAHLKGEPVPESAKGKAPGVEDSAKAKGPVKGAPKKAEDDAPDAEHMAAASALILAAICLNEDDPSAARQAVDAGAKVFGEGMLRFAPAGIWPEGMEQGEQVLDYAIMVMQTLKANAGSDFGFSMLEGLPQAGLARLHLVGPGNDLFNYGDSAGSKLSRPWVGTWLAGQHGNLGSKALKAGAAPGADTAFFNLAGDFMYYNPHAAGDGMPDSLDYGVTGGQVAALRSAWDKSAAYVAFKGGDNGIPTAQLDLGTFVLDMAGKRWGIELGAESDRAPGLDPKAADRSKRYKLYIEGTRGQNTLEIGKASEAKPEPAKKGAPAAPDVGTNQSFDAKAAVLFSQSTPELGVAAVDLSQAYSKATKDFYRGAMMVRGAKPYVVIQDDLTLKNGTDVIWKMHTKAEVAVDGKSAKLTDGKQTLYTTILSPAGATFSTENPPEPTNEQMKKLTGIRVLKVSLAEVKGPQTISIAFSTEEAAPAHVVKPIIEWVGKKR
ncbi:MAG: hypothetical protein NTV80_22285 [Verrucomicrobia bacterium]|nr:hypothetical protein [Verrucomicrobiota bacterium]